MTNAAVPTRSELRVVVGICTCNRLDLLSRVLERLEQIELGALNAQNVWIVVVDNYPNGAVKALCERAADKLPVPLIFLEERRRGISFARNRIVRETLALDAHCLAFIDDDDLPEPDWLVHLLDRLSETKADIIMGNRVYEVPENAAYCVKDRLKQPGMTNSTKTWKNNGLPHQLSTCNVLIQRRVLEYMSRVGHVFDPVFALMGGGDADFFCRARLAGFQFARAEKSFIQFRVWEHRATLKGVLHRKFKGGFSQGLLVRRYLGFQQIMQWLVEVNWRMLRSIATLPIEIFSKSRGTRGLSKIGWSLGALYGFVGGRYDYYGRTDTVPPAIPALTARPR